MAHYVLCSLDGSITLDAEPLLGPGCHRKLMQGCTYSTEHLQFDVAHKTLPELKASKRWRFGVEETAE